MSDNLFVIKILWLIRNNFINPFMAWPKHFFIVFVYYGFSKSLSTNIYCPLNNFFEREFCL